MILHSTLPASEVALCRAFLRKTNKVKPETIQICLMDKGTK